MPKRNQLLLFLIILIGIISFSFSNVIAQLSLETFTVEGLVQELRLLVKDTKGTPVSEQGKESIPLRKEVDPELLKIQAIIQEQNLYLTKEQIQKFLPILEDLEKNPSPSPSRVKKIITDVDGILTKAQKDIIEKWRVAQEKATQKLREGTPAGGGNFQGPTGTARAPGAGWTPSQLTEEQKAQMRNEIEARTDISPEEKQRYIQFLESGQSGQRGQIEGSAPITPAERRKLLLTQFIQLLRQQL